MIVKLADTLHTNIKCLEVNRKQLKKVKRKLQFQWTRFVPTFYDSECKYDVVTDDDIFFDVCRQLAIICDSEEGTSVEMFRTLRS